MHIDLENDKDRIIIVPDSDFERQALWQMLGDNIKAWHKHGVDLTDYVGLVIEKDDKNRAHVDPAYLAELKKHHVEDAHTTPRLDMGEPIYIVNESSIPEPRHPDFPNDGSAIDPSFVGGLIYENHKSRYAGMDESI